MGRFLAIFLLCCSAVGFDFLLASTGALKVQQLNVRGITCSSCEAKIKKRLSKFDGVRTVQVDVSAGTVRLEFDESRVKLEEMIGALERLGYTVSVAERAP